jgi:hypothetical protein
MIDNEAVDWLQKSLVFQRCKNDRDIPLCLSKYTRLPWNGCTFWQVHNSLILELTVKVIISVIVKYVEGEMKFRCSHMSHEVSQVLAIRLAAQRQLELRFFYLELERESMLVGHVPSDGNVFQA